MRILEIFLCLIGIIFGFLLCAPAGFFVWQAIIDSTSGTVTVTPLSRNTVHTDFIMSIGSFTFTCWQMWVMAGALAFAGIALVIAVANRIFSAKDHKA